jgi:hypothetical protein
MNASSADERMKNKRQKSSATTLPLKKGAGPAVGFSLWSGGGNRIRTGE